MALQKPAQSLNFYWLKVVLIFVVLAGWFFISPQKPIDPWGILNLKKIAQMIFALVAIQAIADILIKLLGPWFGTMATGFLGGLISSTALTASLARQSHSGASAEKVPFLFLNFLSGTLAMLAEAMGLIYIGTDDFHPQLLILFFGPVVLTFFMVLRSNKNTWPSQDSEKTQDIEIFSILKLAAFIFMVLGLSKVLQGIFGKSGLFILTFLVSLFEIHGSIIANVQLHDAGAINVKILGALVALSVFSSYVSKFILIFTLGGENLKAQTLKWTVGVSLSLFLSWLIFQFAV